MDDIMDTFIEAFTVDPITKSDGITGYRGMFEDTSVILNRYLEEAATGATKKNLVQKMMDLMKKLLKLISDTLNKILKKIKSLFSNSKKLIVIYDEKAERGGIGTSDGKVCIMDNAFFNVCMDPEILNEFMNTVFLKEAANEEIEESLSKFAQKVKAKPVIDSKAHDFPISNIEKLSKYAGDYAKFIESHKDTLSPEITNAVLAMLKELSDGINKFYKELQLSQNGQA